MNDESSEHIATPGSETGHKPYQDTTPKLELEQNTRIFVRLNPANQHGPPLQGEYVGACDYEFMILRLPTVPGMLNRLLPQTLVEIRYLQAGAVHTFTAEIINHIVKPSLLLFTTYPDRMSITATRRHHRVVCALPMVVHSPKGSGEGLINDLSLGGCRINLELTGQSVMREMAVGDNIAVQTVFSADGRPFGAKAVVRNVVLAGTLVSAGISFTDKQPDFFGLLERYIKLVKALG